MSERNLITERFKSGMESPPNNLEGAMSLPDNDKDPNLGAHSQVLLVSQSLGRFLNLLDCKTTWSQGHKIMVVIC